MIRDRISWLKSLFGLREVTLRSFQQSLQTQRVLGQVKKALTLPRVLFALGLCAGSGYLAVYAFQVGFYEQFGVLPSEVGRSRAEVAGGVVFALSFLGVGILLVFTTFVIFAWQGRPRLWVVVVTLTSSLVLFVVALLVTDTVYQLLQFLGWSCYAVAVILLTLWAGQSWNGPLRLANQEDWLNATRMPAPTRSLSVAGLLPVTTLAVAAFATLPAMYFYALGVGQANRIIAGDWESSEQMGSFQALSTTATPPVIVCWAGDPAVNWLPKGESRYLLLGSSGGTTIVWNFRELRTMRLPSNLVRVDYYLDYLQTLTRLDLKDPCT